MKKNNNYIIGKIRLFGKILGFYNTETTRLDF